MMLLAYSVFDRKSLQYNAPFFQSTDAAATRMFADLANDMNTMVGKHPSDFVLYRIGSYDDSRGELVGCAPLAHIADALALVEQRPEIFPALQAVKA